MTYVKLDCNLVTSTIWNESSDTRIVWIYLLVSADPEGVVRVTVPGIATQCGIGIDIVREALAKFAAPDPDSRSSKHEGRRIRIEREPQFEIHLLNYEDYRNKDHTHAARQARYREKLKLRGGDASLPSRDASRASRVTGGDASRSRSKSSTKDSCPSEDGRALGDSKLYPGDFLKFWELYPRKTAKGAALRAWKAIARPRPSGAELEAALQRACASPDWRKDGGQFVPYPATWLRARCWEDEFSAETDHRKVPSPEDLEAFRRAREDTELAEKRNP